MNLHQDSPAPEIRLEESRARAESLLKQIFEQAGFQLSFTVHAVAQDPSDLESPECVVDFTGADSDLLLERNGALLDALEHVVLKAARLWEEHRVAFDCQDWRRQRLAELRLTAQMAAERVLETGGPFRLSPMTPRERRVIHLALRDRTDLRTSSEGTGADRHVVILPV